MKSKRAPIAQFRAAADMHDVAGHKACLVREQINTGVRNGVTFRAVPERMNIIEITLDGSGIWLLRAPFAKHRGPRAGRANGVHTDSVLRVVKRHGFSERVYAALCCGVGGVNFLTDDADKR